MGLWLFSFYHSEKTPNNIFKLRFLPAGTESALLISEGNDVFHLEEVENERIWNVSTLRNMLSRTLEIIFTLLGVQLLTQRQFEMEKAIW